MSADLKLQFVLALSAFAGAIHMITPDHWIPASLISWQRDWTQRKAALFVSGAVALHLLVGALIYFGILSVFPGFKAVRLYVFGCALITLFLFARFTRFSRIIEVLRNGGSRHWGALAVLSFLGPCESLIPVLAKSGSLGTGYLLPFLSFGLGSWLAALFLVTTGRRLWNNPYFLPRSLEIAQRKSAVVPVAMVLFLGISVLFRLH